MSLELECDSTKNLLRTYLVIAVDMYKLFIMIAWTNYVEWLHEKRTGILADMN